MSWTPKNRVINTRALVANVSAYLLANQADAILWANGSALKAFKKFSSSIANRLVPVYPSIAFSDDNDKQDLTQDILTAQYTVTFEVNVQNALPDTAVTQAQSYWVAIASMLINQPESSRLTNTGAEDAVLLGIETGFLAIKANEMQNDFLQTFQVRATYLLEASGRT